MDYGQKSRKTKASLLLEVSPETSLRHPNWQSYQLSTFMEFGPSSEWPSDEASITSLAFSSAGHLSTTKTQAIRGLILMGQQSRVHAGHQPAALKAILPAS